jgi:hypothetical protein
LPLLFRPYIQLRAGNQQKGLGTGLGLAICKSIVEFMGGAVGVRSNDGGGSAFWAEFPLEFTSSDAGGVATAQSSEVASTAALALQANALHGLGSRARRLDAVPLSRTLSAGGLGKTLDSDGLPRDLDRDLDFESGYSCPVQGVINDRSSADGAKIRIHPNPVPRDTSMQC